MAYLVLCVFFALVGYMIGKRKNRAAEGVFWGLFLGPIGWLIEGLMGGNGIQCAACRRWADTRATL